MMDLISPENIYYGNGSTDKIDDIVSELNLNKVFILCDPILEENNAIENIANILENHNITYDISTNVMAEPTIGKGNEIVSEVRAANPDLIIGVGGGSTLDLTKAASLISKQEGAIENYLNLSADMKLENKKIPNILMPSTSGTGAEVTDIAVFSTGDSKDAITDPLMLATYAIVDPVYSYSLPPKIAAASSIDALTHAIEAYTSVDSTTITDQLSLGAIRLIYNNIREGVWNPQNYDAKDKMSTASLMAGMSFYNAGVAGVHALAYPLGGDFKIPHGESNAVLLPYVYNTIYKSCSNKLATLADIFKVNPENKTSMEISQEIVYKLHSLVKEVGLPNNIKQYGIKENDIELLTDNALKQTRLLARSPLPLDEELIKGIYQDAWEGNI